MRGVCHRLCNTNTPVIRRLGNTRTFLEAFYSCNFSTTRAHVIRSGRRHRFHDNKLFPSSYTNSARMSRTSTRRTYIFHETVCETNVLWNHGIFTRKRFYIFNRKKLKCLSDESILFYIAYDFIVILVFRCFHNYGSILSR